MWPFRNGTNTRLSDVVGLHSIRPCLVTEVINWSHESVVCTAVSVFRTGADEDKPLLYMMVQGTQKSDFVCFVCPFILSTDYLYHW